MFTEYVDVIHKYVKIMLTCCHNIFISSANFNFDSICTMESSILFAALPPTLSHTFANYKDLPKAQKITVMAH